MQFSFITDKITAYTDYVYNLDKMTAYVSNKKRLDAAGKFQKITICFHLQMLCYYFCLILITASNLFDFHFSNFLS